MHCVHCVVPISLSSVAIFTDLVLGFSAAETHKRRYSIVVCYSLLLLVCEVLRQTLSGKYLINFYLPISNF